eukprot:gene25287-biopygen2980
MGAQFKIGVAGDVFFFPGSAARQAAKGVGRQQRREINSFLPSFDVLVPRDRRRDGLGDVLVQRRGRRRRGGGRALCRLPRGVCGRGGNDVLLQTICFRQLSQIFLLKTTEQDSVRTGPHLLLGRLGGHELHIERLEHLCGAANNLA